MIPGAALPVHRSCDPASAAVISDSLQQPERGTVFVGFDFHGDGEVLDQLQAPAALLVLALGDLPMAVVSDLDRNGGSGDPGTDLNRSERCGMLDCVRRCLVGGEQDIRKRRISDADLLKPRSQRVSKRLEEREVRR